MVKVAEHYDLLIENDNDPVLDNFELQEYMDRWDGKVFLDELNTGKEKTVLEIGCGTGRLAKKISDSVGEYVGIDISPKTIDKARRHFEENGAMRFVCGDFLTYRFERTFDVIYSSLTFMHIKRKRFAVKKIFGLLNHKGKAVISLDKNRSRYIDTGYSKIKVYPDDPRDIRRFLCDSGFVTVKSQETESAFILSACKI